MAARTNRTPKKRRDWKIAWLEAFERELTVSAACKAAKIGRTTAYDARQTDEAFAQAWDDLENQTTDTMEREGYRRAVEGTERDIYHQGEVVGKERQFSDTLLIFMLKARKPETYRENMKVEHAGKVSFGAMFVTDPTLAEDARALLRRAASASGDEPSGPSDCY